MQTRLYDAQIEKSSRLTKILLEGGPVVLTIYTALTAFCLYTCIYALRKSFAAATFSGITFFTIDYKVWLVVSQVIGYALSKFLGIKIISEIKATSRKRSILSIAIVAGASWLLFAAIPMPFNIIFLFINGLTLGLVWGLVFGYLEGRTVTEVLGAALSVSFIFSSGLCRSIGAYVLINWHVSEIWMPFVVTCLFALPLTIFLFLLDAVPPPSAIDIALRTKRQPMGKDERKKFIFTFFPGIIMFVAAYVLLTTLRDFRDNFSAELWREFGLEANAAIYTQTEIPVSICVLIVIGLTMFIKNNHYALMIHHYIIITGMVLIGASTILFRSDMLSPQMWMILVGIGLYLGYVPFNSIFFDRLLAAFKYVGTVGFVMYIADAFGYLGSVATLLVKQFTRVEISWLEFFTNCTYFVSIIGCLLTIGSMLYFQRKHI